jgi:O-antigen ligase
VALGIPGLIAYAVILVAGLRRMYRLARSRRDPLAVVALGIVVVTTLQWFNGGQYAVAFLPWLAFGWADNASRRSRPRSPRTRHRLADWNARAF